MKKILFFFLFSLFFPVCFAANKPLEKLTVILDWFPNPDHAPLIIAKQQGFFKAEGLDVELIGPADPTDPPKWVAAKKAEIGITYQPQLLEQIDQGLPLIRIGTLIDKPLSCLVTLKESGIKTLADLKGKQIGSSSTGLTSIMLKAMLEKQGIANKDVELINLRYNLVQALLSRKVDAVTGLMRNVEVPQLDSAGRAFSVFFPEDYGVPNYSELVFVTHIDNIKDNRLPRFLAAVKKGIDYLDAHPRDTWAQYAKQYPESNNKVNRESWFATMPYFAEDPISFDKAEWENFAQFMKKNNLIKKVQPISRYAIEIG